LLNSFFSFEKIVRVKCRDRMAVQIRVLVVFLHIRIIHHNNSFFGDLVELFASLILITYLSPFELIDKIQNKFPTVPYIFGEE